MKVKDLYSENYKSPKNENEDDISSWMFVLASWIGRISMIKMAILLKAINMFNKIIIKMGKKSKGIIYRDKKKTSPKVHMKAQKTSNRQNNPEQKELCWR
jgi:hypothetical protein